MTDLYPLVILAGGLATRLRPLTEHTPKSMLLINGEPFIAHQLRLLQRNGIKKVMICIGYLGDQIRDFVGDGSQFGLQVSYLDDGSQLLGTGGAIKQAMPCLKDAFFILYGDSYLPCDFSLVQKAFENSQKQALMTVYKNRGQWGKSNIEYERGEIIAYDKHVQTPAMQYIDYGLGILTCQAVEHIPAYHAYDLADLYQMLLRQANLAAYEVNERFFEVGSIDGMKDLSEYLAAETAETL